MGEFASVKVVIEYIMVLDCIQSNKIWRRLIGSVLEQSLRDFIM